MCVGGGKMGHDPELVDRRDEIAGTVPTLPDGCCDEISGGGFDPAADQPVGQRRSVVR
jgi:hypothetical protein